MKKNQPVVVLGLGAAGLFLVRQLQNITDNVYAIGRSDDIGMFSKYIRKDRRYYTENDNEIKNIFKKINEINKEKPHLYIASDQYLTLLLNSSINWTEYVILEGSDFETLEIINDKENVLEYCIKNGIRVPESFPLAMAEKRGNSLHYPLIIKWNEKQLNVKKNPIGKIRICQSEKDFQNICHELHLKNISEAMFHVQTFIEGDNSYQFSAGGFYKKGELLAGVVVNQPIQYPQGISACVFTIQDEKANVIQNIVSKFAHHLSYSGFLEMEFKIDENTGEYVLLDINPRPWGWVSVLGKAYNDFYKVFEGEKAISHGRTVVWKSNIRILMSGKNKNNTKVAMPKNDFIKAFDLHDPMDKRPGFMIYFLSILKFFKRL